MKAMRTAVNGVKIINTTQDEKQVSLLYLFVTFFKIGLVSFGGYMAIVSVIQRIMVEKDRTIDNSSILNSIGIASLSPGPLAVNVVGQIGYHLQKAKGALVSTVAIILPSFILMLLLSWIYFSHQVIINWNAVMRYIPAVVSAIILASGIQLYKKELKGNLKKTLLFFVAMVVLFFANNYIVTITLIILGAVAGLILEVENVREVNETSVSPNPIKLSVGKSISGLINKIVFVILIINQLLFITNVTKSFTAGNIKIIMIFAGISLSLFGGGYVMIPIMQALFVNDLHWVSNKEFVDAIAFSQATPGPILISATFIGYKIAGFTGAIFATAAIFAPSVFVVIVVSKIIKKYSNNKIINLLGGIKAVVVALIIFSAYKVIAIADFDILLAVIFAISFILNFWYKINPVYLILATISLGIIKNLF